MDEAWAAFFRELGAEEGAAEAEADGPSWARADWPPQPGDEITAALTGEWPAESRPAEARAAGEKIAARAEAAGATVTDAQMRRAVTDSIRALMLIRAYRIRGHLAADLDPLGDARGDGAP